MKKMKIHQRLKVLFSGSERKKSIERNKIE